MSNIYDLTDEDRERVRRDIENFLEFSRDVLNDPSILDRVPDGASVEAIPIEEARVGQSFDIKTARMVAKVTAPVPMRRTRPRTRTRSTETAELDPPSRPARILPTKRTGPVAHRSSNYVRRDTASGRWISKKSDSVPSSPPRKAGKKKETSVPKGAKKSD